VKSRLYVGELMHARMQPVGHRFTYPLYFYAFDLAELPLLDRAIRGFSYNRRNLVAIHDRDYLTAGTAPIRDKLMDLLAARGVAAAITRVELVTGARLLNYAFNPVSFFYGYDSQDVCICVVAEVNNTFGDKHVYVLDQPTSAAGAQSACYRHPKTFHVSPFNDMQGWYEFRFSPLGDTASIQIDLWREDRPWMMAELRGRARPLTSGTLARTLARYPFTTALTMPRILAQAAVLHFRKRLPVFRRPVPADPWTLRVGPSKSRLH
jgi:cyclopropane-fatty-acyl-phospholipid synthase